MLLHLHVKNLALIRETEIDFSEGLNILTGETGAGKSILIGSMTMALGGKVPKEMLREDAEYALAELVFSVKNRELLQRLQELDIPMEDGELILSRKISGNRSICRLNGETVSASVLKEISSWLIDIHGQHEHQSLLHKKKHLEILDAYAHEELAPVLHPCQNVMSHVRDAKGNWKSLCWMQMPESESSLFWSLRSGRLKKLN